MNFKFKEMRQLRYLKYTAVLVLGFGLVACEPEFENEVRDGVQYTDGDADFSTYVALGNSLTAGFADGALYVQGQENSYPNIMAQQFALVGGGDFTQPLMADNLGGLTLSGNQIADNRRVLSFDDQGNASAVILSGTPTTEITNVLSGPFNNMGIPGARSFHLLADTYGNIANFPAEANPYFIRMASSPSTTVVADAAAQNPTFFSLWIGNNDTLGYATSGGDASLDQLTDLTLFTQAYQGTIATMTQNGAKGVVANLPDVTSIPFFTTVPYQPLSPLDPTFGPQIPVLNQSFAMLNQVFAFLGVPERSIEFSATAASAVVIKDESLTDLSTQITQVLIGNGVDAGTAGVFGLLYGQARQATANDLLVLTSSGVIGQLNTDVVAQLMGLGLPEANAAQLAVNGVTYPLADRWVLIPAEQQEIAAAQAGFNQVIEDTAAAFDLAFFDAKSLLAQVANGGINTDAGIVTATFATGGGFSLDGVHPTARGYALAANGFIDAINAKYRSNVPNVNAGTYPTVFVE